MNIVFTSVGRRVELLRLFKAAALELDLRLRLVGLDIDPLAPALGEVDRAYVVSRCDTQTFSDELVEICRRESAAALFPLTDPDVVALAGLRHRLEDIGTRVAAISAASLDTVTDKVATTQFFKDCGLAAPDSWLPEERSPEEIMYPVFIKPRDGSASRHTYKVRNRAELEFFAKYVPLPVVQEFLPGPEITTDVVCDLGGEVLGVVSRQRIEVRHGEVAKGVTVFDQRILDGCLKIAAALPARGPLTVQCMMRDKNPVFTEINARFGGGLPLGIAAGVHAPRLLLASLAGIQFDAPTLGLYSTGVHMSRFDDSVMLTTEELDRLSRSRI